MMFSLARKTVSLASLPRFHRLWLVPAWAALGLVRLAVLSLPFSRLDRFAGAAAGVDPWLPLTTDAQNSRAAAIGQVIRMAARYTPWNSNCLAQALAARALLGFYKVPHVLFLGVSRDHVSGSLKAHAWVASGAVNVTGGDSFSHFTVVRMYVSPDPARR